EIEDLKNRYMDRFALIYVMSREIQDIDLFNGRLDGAKVEQLLTLWLDPRQIDMAFICGPQDMIESVTRTLRNKGLDKSQIKFELFGSPTGARELRTGRQPRRAAGGQRCEVTIVQDGVRRTIVI